MKLKVTRLYCRSFDLDFMDVQWEIESFDTGQDMISAYEFLLYRSESPEGPWDRLNPTPLKNEFHFRDFAVSLLHKWRKLFYRLDVHHIPSNEVVVAGVCSLEAEPDLIALEIQRQEDILFREFIGRPCWLFPVRTFGEKCTCFDKTLGRQARSNCITCFDTGFIGGYLRPVEVWIQIDPDANNSANTSVIGETQPKNTSCRMGPYPLVKPKDLIIEAENKRWKVVTASATERLRATVHQELAMHLVVRGDVEFKLPVKLADLARTFAEERNFTNPHHVDDDIYGYRATLDVNDGKPRGSV